MQTAVKGHQDTMTTLARIDSPFRGGLVGGDRAGVIKENSIDSVVCQDIYPGRVAHSAPNAILPKPRPAQVRA